MVPVGTRQTDCPSHLFWVGIGWMTRWNTLSIAARALLPQHPSLIPWGGVMDVTGGLGPFYSGALLFRQKQEMRFMFCFLLRRLGQRSEGPILLDSHATHANGRVFRGCYLYNQPHRVEPFRFSTICGPLSLPGMACLVSRQLQATGRQEIQVK